MGALSLEGHHRWVLSYGEERLRSSRSCGYVNVTVGLELLRIVMQEYVLYDPVFSDLSPRHVRSVLQLPQQGHLGSLMIHHGRQGGHLPRLILPDHDSDLLG